MADVTIELARPVQGHGGLVKRVILREPRFEEVMRLGEPVAHCHDGKLIFTTDNVDVIRSYVVALLKPADKGEPSLDATLLEQLCLADTLRLKDAVVGFFSQARLGSENSQSAPGAAPKP